jgi:hypothetical protein
MNDELKVGLRKLRELPKEQGLEQLRARLHDALHR